MDTAKEHEVFEKFLKTKDLKHSRQREEILNIFLAVNRHITADELYRRAKKADSSIGYATVYRTLKLLAESGLCRELRFEGGTARYEHLYEHRHHDHLVCTGCGKMVEVFDPEIEKLQERLFARHNFHPQTHRMELYGLCGRCKGR